MDMAIATAIPIGMTTRDAADAMMLLGRQRPLFVVILAITLALAAAVLSVQKAVVQVFASTAPALALRLSPHDAKATRRQFDLDVLANGTGLPRDPVGAARAARAAIAHEPLDAGVARMLAMSESPTRQTAIAPLMHVAERISRRDLLNQLWLVEDAVTRGDIGGALVHYDRALSVHPEAGAQLFPILTAAIAQPDIRQALVPYLRADRPWAISFLVHAAQHADDPTRVAQTYLQYGGDRAAAKHRALGPLILSRLVALRHYPAAYAFARRLTPNPAALTRAGLSRATFDQRFAPFVWTIDPGVDADITYAPDQGVAIELDSAKRVVALTRDMMLAAGRWRFAQGVDYSTLAGRPLLSWTATCLGADDRRIWSYDTNQLDRHHDVPPVLTVPAGCGPVRLELSVGSGPADDARVTIRDVSLERM